MKITLLLLFFILTVTVFSQNSNEKITQMKIELDGLSLTKEYNIKKFIQFQNIFLDNITITNYKENEVFLSLLSYSMWLDRKNSTKINFSTNFLDSIMTNVSQNSNLYQEALDKKIQWIPNNTDDTLLISIRQRELKIAIENKHNKIINENLLYYDYLIKAGNIELKQNNIDNALSYYNRVMKMNFWDIDNDTLIKYIEMYEQAGNGILTCYKGDLAKLEQLHFNIAAAYRLEQLKKLYIEELGGKYELYQK